MFHIVVSDRSQAMWQKLRVQIYEIQHKRNMSGFNPKSGFVFPLTFSLQPILCVCIFLSPLKPRILVLEQFNSPNLNKWEF